MVFLPVFSRRINMTFNPAALECFLLSTNKELTQLKEEITALESESHSEDLEAEARRQLECRERLSCDGCPEGLFCYGGGDPDPRDDLRLKVIEIELRISNLVNTATRIHKTLSGMHAW
jgi:hypothetical protein